jgi:hypothetical protein
MSSPVMPCRAQDCDGFVKTIIFFSFFLQKHGGQHDANSPQALKAGFFEKKPGFG